MKPSLDRIAQESEDLATVLALFRHYFRKFAGQYAIIVVLIMLSSGATALSAWYVKDVVNSLFVDRHFDFLMLVVTGVIVLFTLRGLAMYFQAVLMARISSRIVADVQGRIFEHILRQRVRFFQTHNSDTMMMLINQGATAFNSILTRVVLNGARDVVTVASLFCVMMIQDPVLTLLCCFAVPLVFVAVNVLLKKIKEISEQELKSFSELNRYMRETVQGIKTIKAFNLEEKVQAGSRGVIEGLRHRSNRLAALGEAPVPVLDALGGVAVGLAILYAGVRASHGAYDAGTFMSFLTALLLASDPARRISQLRVNLRKSLIGVRMVHKLLDHHDEEPVGIAVSTRAERPAIRFEGVRFAYQPGVDIIRGLNLDIEGGETVALVGPSGAGKTTIFNLLLKFYEPCAGRISLGDQDLRVWNTAALRDAISYVGQSNFIFAGTVRENLTLNRIEATQGELDAAIAAVGLTGFIAALPRGYDTPIGELGSSISGGQAQRLNIARAILKDAPVLLLDEVTSALDANNEALIKAYVARQRRRKTTLIIAHRLSTVRDADRIAVIEDGMLVALGRHQDLVENNAYYRNAILMQMTA